MDRGTFHLRIERPLRTLPHATSPPTLRRAVGIRRAIQRAIRRRHRAHARSVEGGPDVAWSAGTTVIGAMPRRQPIELSESSIAPPMMPSLTFKANRGRAVVRLSVWLWAALLFAGGTLRDIARRRDSSERRARRLRAIFERLGGTFFKIGQLLAMRVDILPWAYSVELGELVDAVPPFPTEDAIQAIETAAGKSLAELFQVFDPQPITSTSVACVYQGILANGDKVAVKVRRPGAGALFMADLKVLDWLLNLLEFFTLFRPGFSDSLRREFRATLEAELDFTAAGRNQDVFRHLAQQGAGGMDKDWFTAPKVYFALCSDAVLVQEFISGLWLWEVIAAVEQGEPQARRLLREHDIDPEVLAKRLMWVGHWSLLDNLVFLTDPDPYTIIVQDHNRLAFIDFAAAGAAGRDKRLALQEIHREAMRSDAQAMALATLPLLEPLPPIDVAGFIKELEIEYVSVLHGLHSKQAAWWEHTIAGQWSALLRVTRAFGLTINQETLNIFRSMLRFDTLGLRLAPSLNHYRQFERFVGSLARKERILLRERLASNLDGGLDDPFFLAADQLLEASRRLLFTGQRLLDSPSAGYTSLVGKSFYTASVFIQLVGRLLAVTLAGFAIAYGSSLIQGSPATLSQIGGRVVTNGVYLMVAGFLILINARRILFRLADWEV